MEEKQEPNHPEENEPERPIECTECHKPIDVIYKEIVGKQITCTGMCNSCPELYRKLHGTKSGQLETSEGAYTTGLACGNCGITLDSVRVGHEVGCSECYEIFNDVIVGDILLSDKTSSRSLAKIRSQPVHIGRSPGESKELNPALKLLALTEALNETLKIEDYEQAALLRDQIKKLTEESEGNHGG